MENSPNEYKQSKVYKFFERFENRLERIDNKFSLFQNKLEKIRPLMHAYNWRWYYVFGGIYAISLYHMYQAKTSKTPTQDEMCLFQRDKCLRKTNIDYDKLVKLQKCCFQDEDEECCDGYQNYFQRKGSLYYYNKCVDHFDQCKYMKIEPYPTFYGLKTKNDTPENNNLEKVRLQNY